MAESLDFRAWIQSAPNSTDTIGQGTLDPFQSEQNAQTILGEDVQHAANTRVDRLHYNSIMSPLSLQTGNRLVFPYTPIVTFTGSAEYDDYSFTHANYKYHSYNKSYISEIAITAKFTAQTENEARYLLAAMYFFRANTKSEFGEQAGERAGTPPPILRFNFLGQYQFKNVPVIIKTYTYTYPDDVDYVPVVVGDTTSWVPVLATLMVTLDPYYNPLDLRKEFDLAAFRNGSLINKGFI